jgi:hypothetical protein
MNELRGRTSQLRIVAGREDGRRTPSPFASTTQGSTHDHDDFECSCFAHGTGSHRQQVRRVREPLRHRLLKKR